jgi:hypothetical protein
MFISFRSKYFSCVSLRDLKTEQKICLCCDFISFPALKLLYRKLVKKIVSDDFGLDQSAEICLSYVIHRFTRPKFISEFSEGSNSVRYNPPSPKDSGNVIETYGKGTAYMTVPVACTDYIKYMRIP